MCSLLQFNSLHFCTVNLLLEDNLLTGTLPCSELASLTLLRTLYLGRNSFGGTICSSIGGLTHLADLDMSRGGLIGTLPVELGDLSGLGKQELSDPSFC